MCHSATCDSAFRCQAAEHNPEASKLDCRRRRPKTASPAHRKMLAGQKVTLKQGCRLNSTTLEDFSVLCSDVRTCLLFIGNSQLYVCSWNYITESVVYIKIKHTKILSPKIERSPFFHEGNVATLSLGGCPAEPPP